MNGENMEQYKILLVDDHPLFRVGLQNIINNVPHLNVIDHAESPKDGLIKFNESKPDLVISDLNFRSESGISLIKRIRDINSDCPILVLSMLEESFWAEQVLQSGANGYVQKDTTAEVVLEAIEKTLNGEIYLSNEMQQRLLRQFSGLSRNNTSLQSLSRREMEIFQFMAQGLSTSDIAKSLFISVKTVQTHQSNMKTKLQQNSLKELRDLAEGFSMPISP